MVTPTAVGYLTRPRPLAGETEPHRLTNGKIL